MTSMIAIDTYNKREKCRFQSKKKWIASANTAAALLVALSSSHRQQAHAFRILVPPSASTISFFPQKGCTRVRLYSSIGDDNDGPPQPPSQNNWGDFLDPKKESENLRKARDYMSEESLPISFDKDEGYKDGQTGEETQEDYIIENIQNDDDDDDDDKDEEEEVNGIVDESEFANAFGSSSLAVERSSSTFEAPSGDALANNPYLAVVTKLTPSELISKFTATANPRVQDAVRTTILGLIGGLPKLAFETTTITTGQRLASLMFQLQMTGYMFKNAEYRLSLQQSLGISSADIVSQRSHFLLAGGAVQGHDDDDDDDDSEGSDPLSGKIRGKLRLRYGFMDENSSNEASDNDDDGGGVEVDAEAYMSELRKEVSQLRDELTLTRQEKEEAIRKDLLLYIRTLPDQQLRSLTNDMSQDVLVAMKGLVNAVLSGIGEGKLGPDTVTEQSGEALAQLCMWQLVVGYNLRELEVREEMKNSLFSGFQTGGENDMEDTGGDEGVDFSKPGTLE